MTSQRGMFGGGERMSLAMWQRTTEQCPVGQVRPTGMTGSLTHESAEPGMKQSNCCMRYIVLTPLQVGFPIFPKESQHIVKRLISMVVDGPRKSRQILENGNLGGSRESY